MPAAQHEICIALGYPTLQILNVLNGFNCDSFDYDHRAKPLQNVCIGRHNCTVRGEWLGQYFFETFQEAQGQALEWYRTERTSMAISCMTPAIKLKMAA